MVRFIIVETDEAMREHALPEVLYDRAEAETWCETLKARFGRSYRVAGLAS